jgi:hypothetical protein
MKFGTFVIGDFQAQADKTLSNGMISYLSRNPK